MSSVTIADVEAAAARLEPAAIVQRTPVERSRSLSERCGADVRLKMEHLQRTGSFKTRGAYNAISRAVEQAAERADESELDRVVAASAGNHAQGSPWRRRAPDRRDDRDAGVGAGSEDRGDPRVRRRGRARGSVPGGDGARADADRRPRNAVRPRVRRSGRGRRAGKRSGWRCSTKCQTWTPCSSRSGGGGLAGGVATAIKARSPETRVIGVQTEGASTLSESLAAGELVTREEPGHHRGRDRDRRAERAHLRPVERAPRRRGRRERRRRGRRDSAPLGARETDDRGRGRDRGGHPLNDDALDELDLAGETVVPLLCGGNIDVTTLKEVVTHAPRGT